MSRRNGVCHRITVALMLVMIISTLAFSAWAAQATVEVQILSINDLHGYIMP
jgi:2',3'-cyclic-nucleotide 2'-phosphodiesterase (5'-nucleotidase family)